MSMLGAVSYAPPPSPSSWSSWTQSITPSVPAMPCEQGSRKLHMAPSNCSKRKRHLVVNPILPYVTGVSEVQCPRLRMSYVRRRQQPRERRGRNENLERRVGLGSLGTRHALGFAVKHELMNSWWWWVGWWLHLLERAIQPAIA